MLKGQREQQDHRVLRVIQEPKVQQVILEHKGQLEPKVMWDHRVRREIPDLQEIQELRETSDHKVPRDHKEPKETQEPKVMLDHKVR